MNVCKDMVGSSLTARVKLHNYRFPTNRSSITPGGFAIVIFDILEILEGELPCDLDHRFMGANSFTAAGYNMPKMDTESEYIFMGTLKKDIKYGYQYVPYSVFLNYELETEEEQRKFFSYFMNETRVNALFDAFDDPLMLLKERNIQALTTIKGLGEITALKLCDRYDQVKQNGRAYAAFKDLGLTKKAVDNLVERYKSPDVAIEKINENPYILITEVRGYGWTKADAIALNKGFTKDCRQRVMAYINYYLSTQADLNGNSKVPMQDLLTATLNECAPVTKENLVAWVKEETCGLSEFDRLFDNYLDTGKKDNHKLLFYDKDTKDVGLLYYRFMEKEIAWQIQRLSTAESSIVFDPVLVEESIIEAEKEVGFEYTDEQKDAIYNIFANNVSILTGSGGTGKTFTLKPLIKAFQKMNLKVEQTALAGRAASLLSSVTNIQGKTIHRLLKYVPELESFAHTENNPLSAKVIILDETSMVGEDLFLSLLKAIASGSKLIMLGDIKQLPPLSVGNILLDCLKSGYIKTSMLTKIHRQAMRSGITAQAVMVSNGESICKNNFYGSEIRGELKDFKLVGSENKDLVAVDMLDEFKDLYIHHKIPAEDIQLIVPNKNNSEVSCRALNKRIQEIVNPGHLEQAVTITVTEDGIASKITFKPFDRVIVTRNNYHAKGTDGKEKPIFNGNIGEITEITEDSMIIRLPEQGKVVIARDDWKCIDLAYCITVHKLQGSQAPFIIIGVCYSAYALLSRELVYTALTRASQYCVLVAEPRALNMAIRTSCVKTKQTWLKNDLAKYNI